MILIPRGGTSLVLAIGAILLLPTGVKAQPADPADASNIEQHSVARRWIDLLLDSIRNDRARVVVHARNLFHVSAAMWDAWVAWSYDDDQAASNEGGAARPTPWLFQVDKADLDYSTYSDREESRRKTISYSAYNLLKWRFADSPGFDDMSSRYDNLMTELGYSTNTDMTDYEYANSNDPRALGIRIADAYITFGLNDSSNEYNDHANQWYRPVNDPLFPDRSGTQGIEVPDRWQPLSLRSFIDQSGHIRSYGYPAFLGPEWGHVTPFSLRDDQKTDVTDKDGNQWPVYIDPGPPPLLGDSDDEEELFLKGFEQVLLWSDHLDSTDGVLIDISPNSIGNAKLPTEEEKYKAWKFYDPENGGDIGKGYTRNPVTGETYPPQYVPRADYARVLAEFWADGPDSETPPGHWFSILNDVMDHPLFERRIGGRACPIDPLEYDVKAYFALGGGLHDAAIAAWSVKGRYDYVRPISVIRWMAENGQRSDPNLPSYHPQGLQLIPGQVEVITAESSQPGERHADLRNHVNEIAVRCWRGPDYIKDPDTETAGCGWILALDWWPYQRPTFVTPNFAGYVSGHSTFSRTAAEILTLLTGSPYFPGGLGEYVAPAGDFLVFENGPSVDVRLQWVSYRDASDQCSLSRIWGGIHPPADDIPGRLMGTIIGPQAFELAKDHFEGIAKPQQQEQQQQIQRPQKGGHNPDCPADVTGDGKVDWNDYNKMYARYIGGDSTVSYADVMDILEAFGDC